MVYIPATTSTLLSEKEPNVAQENGIGVLQGGPTQPAPEVTTGGPPEVVTPPQESFQPLPARAPVATPQIGEAPTMTSGMNYVDADKSTVAGQLSNLLGSDSKYIQEARRQGIEQGASRGMLNTAATGGLAVREAIAAGVPIAAQDASTYAAAQGRQQEGDITGALERAGYESQGILQEQRAAQTADLSAQEYMQGLSRDKQQQLANTANIRVQGEISQKLQDSGYASQQELQDAAQAGDREAIRLQGEISTAQQEAQIAASKFEQARELASNKELTRMGLDAEAANLYTSILGSLTNTTLSSISDLLNNINITDVGGAMDVLEGFLGSTNLGASAFDPGLNLTGRPTPAAMTTTKPAGTKAPIAAPAPTAAPAPVETPREPGVRDFWSRYR